MSTGPHLSSELPPEEAAGDRSDERAQSKGHVAEWRRFIPRPMPHPLMRISSRRWVRALVVAGSLLLLLLLAAWASALSVRNHLSAGRDEMDLGKADLLAGDSADAELSFAAAEAAFTRASNEARGPWLRIAGWLPVIGRTPDAIRSIADAGREIAGAGRGLAQVVSDLPGGLAFLAPDHGAVPIDRIAPLADVVARADVETGHALMMVENAPTSLLPGPVADARQRAEEQLSSLHGLLDSASLLLKGLPAFLGQDGPSHYFFAAENPAELRGTGGVLGAFSILTIDRGRFTFTKFSPTKSLPIPLFDQVPPPSAEFAQNYDQFRGQKRFWQAINLTPDFPTAAQAIVNAYEVATGIRLDGVVTADPFALEALMKVTGPATIPSLGVSIGPYNVVPFTTNEAYSLIHDPAKRQLVIGDVAQDVFSEFILGITPTVGDLRILAHSAGEGHVHVFSTDPDMERGLRATGVGGTFNARPGDFFSVVKNSAGANKTDYYQDRSITYSIRLGDGGTAHAAADVHLTNNAPTSGQPHYVIGPFPGYSTIGENVSLLQVYCGSGCQLESAKRNGSEILPWYGTELGHPYFRDYFGIPSGGTADSSFGWWLPHAWQGNGSGGTYRLTFVNQTTIRPSKLQIAIRVPEGMSVVKASPGMRVYGGGAVWQGVPPHRLELEVTFQPSLLERIWGDLTRFLSKPVIRF